MKQTLSEDTHVLLADIGGTNTRVALAGPKGLIAHTIRRFRNRDFDDLPSVFSRYIGEMDGVECRAACVAVAGPVRNNQARMTNLDWQIDAETLFRATRAETVAILNDLEAQGHALGRLAKDSLQPVLPALSAPSDGTCLVIGIGTGFNTATVYRNHGERLVTASESGHANFPVLTARDYRFCQYVAARCGYPELDSILSGRGLENMRIWLSGADKSRRDTAAEIMAALATGKDPMAKDSVAMFVRMLATVTSNLALTFLPFSGIFLTGGVARAMAPHLIQFGFAEGFASKGRFSDFMHAFPVSVIMDDYAALTGCAAYLQKIHT